MSKRMFAVMTTLVFAMAATAQEPEPRALASQLRSSDAVQQRRALQALDAMDKRQLPDELKDALSEALLVETKRNTRRYWQHREGKPLEPLQDPELVAALARAVVETRDRNAIPAMAESLGPGFSLVRGLVEFGTLALPDVIRVTMAPGSTHDTVDHGLITLRMIVERAGGVTALTRRQATQVREVAEHYLTTRPRFISTLWWAIDLASVLDDAKLRAHMQRLATDPELAAAMGAWDQDVVVKTQQRAADRLAGLQALPRP
jgi:hypothetical protein